METWVRKTRYRQGQRWERRRVAGWTPARMPGCPDAASGQRPAADAMRQATDDESITFTNLVLIHGRYRGMRV